MAKGPRTRRVEREYMRKLGKIAVIVGELVESHDVVNDPAELAASMEMLRRYSNALEGWARAAGTRMVHMANQQDLKYWESLSTRLAQGTRRELNSENMRPTMARLVEEQVRLIQSIPDKAAERVHHLVTESLSTGRRAEEIAKEIGRTEEVTRSRAQLIARTEVQRSHAHLTTARAQGVGAEEYIWRTVGDSDVRYGHRQMANKVFKFSDPPPVNEGTPDKPRIMYHGPGEIWNCRCYAEPIIPE